MCAFADLFVKVRVDLFVVFDFDVVAVFGQVARILGRRFDVVRALVDKAKCFVVLFAACAAAFVTHVSDDRLADVVISRTSSKTPTCSACLYSSQTRRHNTRNSSQERPTLRHKCSYNQSR